MLTARVLRRFPLPALLVVFALVAGACVVPWSTATYTFTVQTGVVYGQGEVDGGGTLDDLLLDLYVPAVPANRPMALMVMIPGGNFDGGSRSDPDVVASAEEYARRGFLVAAIDHRLVDDDPIPSSRVQPIIDLFGGNSAPAFFRTVVAAVDDTLTALDFLQARPDVHAPWTTLWGTNSGAVTALMTGYSLDDRGIARPPVAAVIDVSGGFFGTAVGNPFDDPGGSDPVLFVAHGTADLGFPFVFATQIQTWANDAGLPLDFHAVPGAGSTFDLFTTEASPGVSLFQRSVDFLHETVFDGLPQGPLY